MLASKTNKSMLKPYSINFPRFYDPIYYINYQITQDLKDLKNASIKELTISNTSFSLENNYRRDLTELLRNTNIKKIVLELNHPSIDFLILISKLIGKNTTIKEIEIKATFCNNSSVKEFLNNAWYYFIDTISSRLVKLKHANNTGNLHWKIDSLLLRNPNLKEIEIINKYNDDMYPEYIKEVLGSEKYLDDFSISPKFAFNNQFYDLLSKMKSKAEIDTLHIESTNNNLATIENAFLFKIKTIRIPRISELKVLDAILKLSNNPHNTVKRIVIDQSENYWPEIILELKSLDLKDYNLKMLPKIYLHGYRELILDEINNQHSFLNIGKYDISNFCLILKKNAIEVDNLTELLYILFNSPAHLKELRVEHDENDMKLKNTNCQYLTENRKRIILGMMETYYKFEVDKVRSKRNISKIEFKFKKNSPELNFVYFTVLEIMVLMKIEIECFILDNWPISELVEFMDKYKSLDSLQISNIYIKNCETIDKENIEKLYQYSHLIKNQILIDFNEEYIDIDEESVQVELIDIFHSRSRNYNNFVLLNQEALPFMTETLDFYDYSLPDYILKIKTLKNKLKSYTNDIYFCKHIRDYEIDFNQYDLKYYSNIFIFLKEHEYYISEVYFLKKEKRSIYLRMFFMIFETICNSKYKGSKVNHLQYEFGNNKFSKKCKRYLNIHNIYRSILRK